MGAAQASLTAETLFTEFSNPRTEVKIKTKFIPHVELLDKVLLKYSTPPSVIQGATLWNHFYWGGAMWTEQTGQNIDFDYAPFKVLNVNHDFDRFESSWLLRDIS
jgi:hypothetical protein